MSILVPSQGPQGQGGSLGVTGPTDPLLTPQVFDAGVLLDLSVSPGGSVPNLGTFSHCNFSSYGTLSRQSQGDYYCWYTSTGNSGCRLSPNHTNNTSGAYFSACNTSDGSASFTIVDTNNDLQALYQFTHRTNVPRPYKIDVSCSGPYYMSGYIGEISKNTDTYVINVYNASTGTTRNWKKYGTNSWNTNSVTWMIYPADFDIDNSASKYYTQMMWYYPGTDASAYEFIMGKWDWMNSGDTLFYGYGIQHTNAVGAMQVLTQTPTYSIPMTLVESGSRWIHLTVSQSIYRRRVYINGRPVVDNTSILTAFNWGLFGWGVASVPTAGGIPAGSKIALPRYWSGEILDSTVWSLYTYERDLLGLSPNH